MSVMLASLVLNEMEWLPRLYTQHKDWPNLLKWIFVEAADKVFAKTNPNMVTLHGLSTDGTSEYLRDLASHDNRIVYIPFGITSHADPAQGKVAARQAYLDKANNFRPEWVIVLDADEFYTKQDQANVNQVANELSNLPFNGFRFRQRHIWRPRTLVNQPLMEREVTGAYWAVPHTRVWKWRPEMKYASNHNWPEGYCIKNLETISGMPQCVHMGFASKTSNRRAKHLYYIARGEGRTDKRQMYVDCRRAFENWTPGKVLPHGAKVIPYSGPVPEVFLEREAANELMDRSIAR